MRFVTFMTVAMLALVGVVSGATTLPPTTPAATTKPPTTPAATTKPPTTSAPTTKAPTPTPCPGNTPVGSGTHCTIGYWKNHDGTLGSSLHPQASTWPINTATCAQYSSSDPISLLFPDSASNPAFSWTSTTVQNILAPYGFSGSTSLHNALGAIGGGLNNVFRQGVAAFFDSLTYTSGYTGYTTAQVRAEFYNQILNNGDGGTLDWYASFCHEGGSTCPVDAAVPQQYQPIWGTCCPFPGIWDSTNKNCGRGVSPPGGRGDPQIGGFHGQSFQFHGLADEVFNLISTPTLQLNGHFVYLSSGKCDYTETTCWTHPGTYIDQLGFAFGDYQLKMVAGTHSKGLHMEINGEQVDQGIYKLGANGTDVTITFEQAGRVHVKTVDFAFNVINSDMFFNVETALLDRHLLRLGSAHHKITDRNLCKQEEQVDETKFKAAIVEDTHNHGAIEALIDSKYGGAQVPLHGLIGQTWRNVLVCGKHWVGTVSDYIASDLFADDYFFNFYHQE